MKIFDKKHFFLIFVLMLSIFSGRVFGMVEFEEKNIFKAIKNNDYKFVKQYFDIERSRGIFEVVYKLRRPLDFLGYSIIHGNIDMVELILKYYEDIFAYVLTSLVVARIVAENDNNAKLPLVNNTMKEMRKIMKEHMDACKKK